MPWMRVLSEDAVLEMKSRRAQAPAGGQHDLVHALESIAGVFHEKWDLELGASAIQVQSLLETRAHAYVMCRAGHLGHWNVYIQKLLALCSRLHRHPWRRSPRCVFRATP